MKKKVISFDLDGTLVSSVYGDMVWNHGIPEVYAKKYAVTFDEARTLVMDQYRSVGDGDLLWYEIEYWLKRLDLPVTADELLTKYEPHIEALPDTQEVIEALKDTYTLVISSNAARIFVEKELGHTGLARHFRHIISATTDYKMIKMEPAFYRKLCQTLGVSHEEIVHVGDHKTFDYEVPSALGIEAYYFKGQGSGFHPAGVTGGHESTEGNGRVIHNMRELLDKL